MKRNTLGQLIRTFLVSGLVVSTAAQAEGLFDNNSLELSTRNIAMYLDEDTSNDIDQFAWAQGITIDYQSGYLANMIGVDASYAGVIKLGANDDFSGRNLVRNNDGVAEGFNKVSQFFAKAKFEQGDLDGHLYGGWKELSKTGAITISNSRAIASSYQGVSGDVNWKGLRLRGAYVNRFSDRDTPQKERFETMGGKQIESILTGDLRYSWDKKNYVNLFSGESKDYLRRSGLEFKAVLPVGDTRAWSTSGYLYQNDGQENWEGIAFDDKASHYNLNLHYKTGNWQFEGSYGYTKAERTNGLGMFYWDLGKNTDGNFNSKADGAGLDFIKDGEQFLAFQSMYNMADAGVPGLMVGAKVSYGFGMEFQGANIDEGALDLLAMYHFQQKELKGLRLMGGVGPGYSYVMDGAMNPVIENGDWKKRNIFAVTFMLDYQFSLL